MKKRGMNMNETQINNMLSYFDGKIAACQAEAEALELDHRRDEAIFAKVRLNIYDVFRTVFKVAATMEDNAERFFLAKLEEIPRGWQTSLALAQQHGNTRKTVLEQIKLDTAAQIRSTFDSIREVRA